MADTVKVKSGDTLSAIAKANNTTVSAIVAANPQITNPNLIKPGQVFTVPSATPAPSGVNTNTLAGIAAASSTNASTLQQLQQKVESWGYKIDPNTGLYNTTPTSSANASNNKTVSNTIKNADGTSTVVYSDGTYEITGTANKVLTATDVTKSVTDAITALNASWQAKFDALTTKQTEANRATVTTALEDFKANLKLAGLDTLATTIDDYIKQDLTASQIKINLVGTQAYKDRFPGMESLSKAGKAVNEATYISMERGMINVLKAYGLDDKVFGTTEKLGQVIGNQVSVAEYENRVQIAADRVQKNPDVLAALNQYYKVDTAGATGYLLDPKTGMDVVKKQIRASEIGAAAQMYQFDLSQANAESYINVSGTSDLNALKESFGKARVLANTQSRLASIEGTNYSELEAVASTLGQDQIRQLESQRRALREQARFAGQSGISASSLKTESTI
jgi:LysM repeat protein